MCNSSRDRYSKRKGGNKGVSEKMKFYRSLRSFIIFNVVMAGLWLLGSGLAGLWFVAKIWGVFLAIHYIKINGMPGTKGWLSDDWEDWMEERERRRWEEEPEIIVEEPEPQKASWRERDFV